MANRARGEVTLRLGDATYVLRPTFGAVCEIEDAVGTTLYDMGRRLESADITARDLVGFAAACLASAGHAVERERLGALIVEGGSHAAIAALLEFCRAYAFGGVLEKKVPAPPQSTTMMSHTDNFAPS